MWHWLFVKAFLFWYLTLGLTLQKCHFSIELRLVIHADKARRGSLQDNYLQFLPESLGNLESLEQLDSLLFKDVDLAKDQQTQSPCSVDIGLGDQFYELPLRS